MSDTSGLDAIVEAIGKTRGTVKLDLVEAIAGIGTVDGDNPNTYHITVTRPFRGVQFGKEVNEFEALKQLRKAKTRYKQLHNEVEREIAWILGKETEDLL